MRVTEIFSSIQGESTHAGLPCTFVRTTGCDQRCDWCDTAYAFEGGAEFTLDALYEEVARRATRLVEVTGGEPLIQPDVPEFLSGLADRGYEVLLETGGSQSIRNIDPRVRRIVDLKPPGSDMTDLIHWENLDHLTPTDEVKFVLTDRVDYEWARQITRTHGLEDKLPVLFSPVMGRLEAATLADWILEDGLYVRMQLQIHKLIWAPEIRGV
ncbi:MAG: radical SAM protein [Leptospirillia bacterium]